MPTYEYECTTCGHEFELFQQMSESVKRKCPRCHKRSLQRHVGIGAGVLFKGSGFYETDYRSDSYKKAAEAEKKSIDGTGVDGKADASKSDAKPAAEGTAESMQTKKERTASSRAVKKKKSLRKS